MALRAHSQLNFASELDATAGLFRRMVQKSYRYQRRVMGLGRAEARALVIHQQAQIYSRVLDRAQRRVAWLVLASESVHVH